MIKLYADIELLSGNNSNFLDADCNISGMENSATIKDVLGKKVEALNPFIIGEDFHNRTLEEKLEYFVGSEYADEQGIFPTSYTVSFSTSKPIDTFFISFDTYNKAFPKSLTLKAYINGSMTTIGTFADNDSQWEFKLDEPSTVFRISVSNWSMPNKPFVLTGIYTDLHIHLDYSKITDIDVGIVTQADFSKPSYGIVSNSGSISFNDFYNEISDYIELGLLKEGALVQVYIENSLVKYQKYKVCEMYTDKWTYDEENKSVTVSLVDGLEKLQEIQFFTVAKINGHDVSFEGIPYFPRISKSVTYKDIYNILKEKTEIHGIKVLEFDDYPDYIKEYISSIRNPYPYMNSSTLWFAWQQFGEATKTHIYKNSEGCLALHD